MSLKWTKKVVLAKVETTYGTDATPTSAANAILTRNGSITPIEGDELNRNLDLPTLGNSASGLTNKRVTCSFEVEAQGSGTADTPPAFADLLKMCGFAETVNAATDVQYDPVSASFDAGTLYFYVDNILHKLLGARGNITFRSAAGEYPFFTFNFTGLFVAASEAAPTTPDHSAFIQPLEVNNANTPTFTLHTYAAKLKEFTWDLGNQVKYRNLVGQEEVSISDRKPTGSVVIQAPAISAKDYLAIAAARTAAALQLIHGTAAGKIIQIDMPKVELGAPTYQNEDGDLYMTIPLRPIINAGDDEIKITTK